MTPKNNLHECIDYLRVLRDSEYINEKLLPELRKASEDGKETFHFRYGIIDVKLHTKEFLEAITIEFGDLEKALAGVVSG